MRNIGLVLDPCFEEHDTGPGHPESPARLSSIRHRLAETGVAGRCVSITPREATDRELARIHDAAYLARARESCARGAPYLDSGDTAVSRASEGIARRAAGAVLELCEQVAAGRLDGGFAAVRPPGHHAERALAMGFCLYNNVAVAARHLRDGHGMGRVLVVDWDVHHGNGTQHLFEEDPSVFYFSIHQMPLYPGTGAAGEEGIGSGAGTTLNRPLPPGAGDEEFLEALESGLAEATGRFDPDFVLISAGFDAHRSDPLGGLVVSTEGYRTATRTVLETAGSLCDGRIVSVLEGGYDLDALAESVAVHVAELLVPFSPRTPAPPVGG